VPPHSGAHSAQCYEVNNTNNINKDGNSEFNIRLKGELNSEKNMA